jgi:glycosyltransferase involved in cell wall biosynthesis
MPENQSADHQPLRGKRILIIVENLPVPFDRRVWQEALALKDAGAIVTVICPRTKDFNATRECLQGIWIHRHSLPTEIPGKFGYLREYLAAIANQTRLAWRIYFQQRFDVIQACNPPDMIFLVAAPFKLLGVKFIFDHHDLCPELFEAKFNRRGPFWSLLKVLERLTFGLADVSIATNGSYRRIAIERGRMKPERTFVVRSAPDLTRFVPCEPVAHYRNGRRYMVGYVGVMGEQEGVELLLAAAGHLISEQRRTDIQFCLVGGGPSVEKLQALSQELGLADHVSFLGRTSDKVLIEVLSTADVCVNPDRVNPFNAMSTMNKIMEYMAMSKPIVQFDLAEGRVSAGAASLYARPNDPLDLARHIESLLDNPDRRSRMGLIGKLRLQRRLSWQQQVPQLISAYQTALGSQRQRPTAESAEVWAVPEAPPAGQRKAG